MPMYNLKEYSNNYSKKYGSLCQSYRDKPDLVNGVIVDFPADNKSALFKFKQEITGKTDNYGKIDVELMVLLNI